MAITGLTGLRAEYSSAPARGMAGDVLGAGVVGDGAGAGAAFSVDAGSSAGVGLPVGAALWVDVDSRTVRLADSTAVADFTVAVGSMAVAGSTVVAVGSMAVAGSTVVAVASTAEAVDTAADTGNRSLNPGSPIR